MKSFPKPAYTKMKFPPGMGTSITIHDVELTAEDDGWVEVPKNFVAECQSHGLQTEADLKAEADKLQRDVLAQGAPLPPTGRQPQQAARR